MERNIGRNMQASGTTDPVNEDNAENATQGRRAPHSAPNSDDERISGKLIGAIVAVGSLAFIGILTETVMTVLFPQLMSEFGVDTATVQWITTIYLLVVAATMPLSSYLNRKVEHRTLFLAAVLFAVLGSLIMIVGHAFPVILVARVIQGIGSGIATPLMNNIILEQSPRTKVGRLMGVGSLVITVAPAIGPTVGGAVSSILPWRAIFVIVIPVVLLISLPVGLKCVEQHRPTEDVHLNPLQFVSIVLALWRSGDVPQPGRCGHFRRGVRRFRHGAGCFRRRESRDRSGIAAVLRMVIASFVLAADPFGMVARPYGVAASDRLYVAADRRHWFRLCDHQSRSAVLGHECVLGWSVGPAGRSDRCVLCSDRRHLVRPFRTGSSDSRSIQPGDLRADPAAGLLHGGSLRAVLPDSISFSVWDIHWAVPTS